MYQVAWSKSREMHIVWGVGSGCGDAAVGAEDLRGVCGERECELMVLGPGTGDFRVMSDPKFYCEA